MYQWLSKPVLCCLTRVQCFRVEFSLGDCCSQLFLSFSLCWKWTWKHGICQKGFTRNKKNSQLRHTIFLLSFVLKFQYHDRYWSSKLHFYQWMQTKEIKATILLRFELNNELKDCIVSVSLIVRDLDLVEF